MWFSSWLRNVSRRTPTSSRQRASFRPLLEALEERTLLSGGGLPYATPDTVKQLIADIKHADKAGGTFTIDLKPNTTFDLLKANNPTNGANGLPVIGGKKSVDLTILGNGDTIERGGSKAFRLFDVAPRASLTLEDVTLQGGSVSGSVGGGTIYNQGTLIINHSIVSHSSAAYGGGIYNDGGTVKVSNSGILSGNSALDAGGGIYNNAGNLTISHSSISSNFGSGVPTAGAGIFSQNGTVAISNSILSGNENDFTSHYNGLRTSSGGAIYNIGGTLTISHSTLSDNSASGWGGGIYNDGGTVKVSNSSTLSGNSARLGSGGAISNDGGNVTISDNSILSDNSGYEGGGLYNYAGTLAISNSTLSGNTAFYGGGMAISGGTVSVSTCSLTGNVANTGSYATTSGNRVTYGGMGGGIYNATGTLMVNNSVFNNNSPDNINGPYSGSGNTGVP